MALHLSTGTSHAVQLSPALPWPLVMLPSPNTFDWNIRWGSDHTSGISMQVPLTSMPPLVALTATDSTLFQCTPNNHGLRARACNACHGHPGGARARGVSTSCMSIWDGARIRQIPVGHHLWGAQQQLCHFPSLPFGYSCQKRPSDIFTELSQAPPVVPASSVWLW